jgi:hypothetical protein
MKQQQQPQQQGAHSIKISRFGSEKPGTAAAAAAAVGG